MVLNSEFGAFTAEEVPVLWALSADKTGPTLLISKATPHMLTSNETRFREDSGPEANQK